MRQFKGISTAFVLFFSLSVATVFSQQDKSSISPRSILINVNQESIFDEVIDYLIEKGYFIQSLDKDAGFIQAKMFTENKKLLSAKTGERITFNFFIRPQDVYSFQVILDIYVEEQSFGGDTGGSVYYYEEKGRPEDSKIYRDILEDLQKWIEIQ